jgi:hypothetical protein
VLLKIQVFWDVTLCRWFESGATVLSSASLSAVELRNGAELCVGIGLKAFKNFSILKRNKSGMKQNNIISDIGGNRQKSTTPH